MECEFLNPVNISDSTTTPQWAFSHLACTSSESVLVQNANTGAEFYLSKKLDYGEAIIIWFLTAFAIFLIFKTAWHFFFRK